LAARFSIISVALTYEAQYNAISSVAVVLGSRKEQVPWHTQKLVYLVNGMERFPLTEQVNRFPELFGQSAANAVGKSDGMVLRGSGIPRASKAERRQASTQRKYKQKWIREKQISPRKLHWHSSLMSTEE
jgi:hypothetical protein